LQIKHRQGERQGGSDNLHWPALLRPEGRTQRVVAQHESVEAALERLDIERRLEPLLGTPDRSGVTPPVRDQRL